MRRMPRWISASVTWQRISQVIFIAGLVQLMPVMTLVPTVNPPQPSTVIWVKGSVVVAWGGSFLRLAFAPSDIAARLSLLIIGGVIALSWLFGR
jgi:hypothetical protein